MARMEEPLAKMKFVCKEFWTALLGHHAGGLKTNHKVGLPVQYRICINRSVRHLCLAGTLHY